MKLLITGATGFIGKNLSLRLQKEKIDFKCIIREQSNKEFFTKNSIDFFVFDNNINSLIEYIKKEKFDGVVHLASLFIAEHKNEQIDELISSNVLFGTKLLQACVESDVKWFLNTGTFWQHYHGEVYNPVNLYAATKQAFEDMAKYYSEAFNLKFVTLKLNDTYGEGDTRRKIFAIWEQIAKTGEILDMSKGEQYIDIVHVSKAVDAYMILIDKLQNGTLDKDKTSFYITSGENITLKELAKRYELENGVKLNINWGAREYRKREVMRPMCKEINIFELRNIEMIFNRS